MKKVRIFRAWFSQFHPYPDALALFVWFCLFGCGWFSFVSFVSFLRWASGLLISSNKDGPR